MAVDLLVVLLSGASWKPVLRSLLIAHWSEFLALPRIALLKFVINRDQDGGLVHAPGRSEEVIRRRVTADSLHHQFRWQPLQKINQNLDIILALHQLDYTVIMGTTVFYGAFLVLMVLLVDIIYGLVDPRIRLQGRSADA